VGIVVMLVWWLELPRQTVHITTNVSLNPVNDEVYTMQYHVVKFVSDLRQVGRWFSPGTPVSSSNKTAVIGTDCKGICKSNYHTITTTTASLISYWYIYWYFISMVQSYHDNQLYLWKKQRTTNQQYVTVDI
jgi:hypothetical protein